MLVTVKRNPDGTVDTVSVLPETIAEVRELGLLVENQVNLKTGVLFLNKEPGLAKRSVETLAKSALPEGVKEAYRHT
jgi:hypothetical protein